MFNKSSRLTTSLFNGVFSGGKNIHSKFFHAKFVRNNMRNSRFAIVISKKILPGAFKRHLVKRRISAFLKKEINRLPIGDYVVFVKKEAIDLSGDDLKQAIEVFVKDVVKML